MIKPLVEIPLAVLTWGDYFCVTYSPTKGQHMWMNSIHSSSHNIISIASTYCGLQALFDLQLCRHNISIRLRSRLWLGHCITSIHFLFSCPAVDLLHLTLEYFGYTKGLMVSSTTVRCPGPVAENHAQNIPPLHHLLTASMRCLVVMSPERAKGMRSNNSKSRRKKKRQKTFIKKDLKRWLHYNNQTNISTN